MRVIAAHPGDAGTAPPAGPLVSICVPSYNHAPYLGPALDSCLAQTYPHCEIVVADDGSTDGSYELARTYADRHPGVVRLVTHPDRGHRGISATVNLTIANARGAYWSPMASDDLLLPDKVRRQITFLERNLAIGWVYSRLEIMNGTGTVTTSDPVDLSTAPDAVAALLERNVVPAITVLARRDCVVDCGPHTDGLIYSDWEFWIRMAARSNVGFLDFVAARHRRHSTNTSMSSDPTTELDRAIAVLQSLRDNGPRFGGRLTEPRIRALVELQHCRLAFQANRRGGARASLAAAFRADATLAGDGDWLAAWATGGCTRSRGRWRWEPMDAAFDEWLLGMLWEIAGREFAERLGQHVAAVRAGQRAVRCFAEGDIGGARHLAFRALRRDRTWLKDPVFVRMLAALVVGPRMIGRLRWLRKLRSPTRA